MYLKHGMAGKRTPEYRAWEGMKRRCKETKTKDSKNYRERGIKICRKWLMSFEAFLADVGLRPGPGYTLDRKDNNGHYTPGNVRWATHSEQNSNRRYSRLLSYLGRTQTLTAWAAEFKLNQNTIRYRLSRGRSFAEAVTTTIDPVKAKAGKARLSGTGHLYILLTSQ